MTLSKKIPPLAYLFAAALATSLLSLYYPLLRFEHAAAHYSGLLLITVGGLVALIAAGLFVHKSTSLNPYQPETTSVLVNSGMFRFSRNPMYLGMLMALMGWAMVNATLTGGVPVVLFAIAITRWQIIPEEETLERLFADEYLTYKRRVRRWL